MCRTTRSPGLSGRHILVVLIDDARLEPRNGTADSAGVDQARLDVVRNETAAHRPEFDEGKAEPLLARGVLGGVDAGAEAEADLVPQVWKYSLVRMHPLGRPVVPDV